MQVMRKIILSGELGRKYGRFHRFAISTPAEAIRALCANFSDFMKDLTTSQERGVGYRILVDKHELPDVEGLHDPFSKTIRIVPVLTGAKSGLGSILLGTALIAAAFLTGGASLLAGNVLVFSGIAGQMAFGIGVSLVLGGVSQMLAPQPKAGMPQEDVTNNPSYAFNGPVNTTRQGHCVPLGYGRLIVGSAVISAGIAADDFDAAGVS